MGIAALQQEIDELRSLANSLAERVPAMEPRLAEWFACAEKVSTIDAVEVLAARLRRLWLCFAHETAQATTRTPLAHENPTTPSGAPVDFGYERDLAPDGLEARADVYLPPPQGWKARSLIFSSGQAALGAVLLHLAGTVGGRRMHVAHIGAYFETSDLLALFGANCVAQREDDPRIGAADLLILEPTSLEAQFRCLDLTALKANLAQHGTPPLVLVDTTLSHLRFPVERILSMVTGGALVIRMTSMLKLDQAGFELANAGLLTLLGREEDALKALREKLAKIRSATGTGPAFADVCALDAPWFLNTTQASAYSAAIFAHNADAARHLREHALFSAVLHPLLSGSAEAEGEGWAEAPFVVLKLGTATKERYGRLEDIIAARAAEAGIPLCKGGSFGFRMHRFEMVEPEGEPPFLRLALGASSIGVEEAIALIADLCEGDLATDATAAR